MKLLIIATTLAAFSVFNTPFLLAAEPTASDPPKLQIADNPFQDAPAPSKVLVIDQTDKINASLDKVYNILIAAGVVTTGIVGIIARLHGQTASNTTRIDQQSLKINTVALQTPPPAKSPPVGFGNG